MAQITVNIPKSKRKIISTNTISLLEILNRNEIMTYAPCGGKGVCGKCKIEVKGDLSNISNEEKEFLTKDEIKNNIRLACKTYVNSEATVELIENSTENKSKEKIKNYKHYKTNSRIIKKLIVPKLPSLKHSLSVTECILEKNQSREVEIGISVLQKISSSVDYNKELTATFYDNELIDVKNSNSTGNKYGVAIDIGTTTLACYLIDLNTGSQLAVQSLQNPQTGYGADVISRINYCIENKDGLKTLCEAIRNALNSIIHSICKQANIDSNYIYECILVGNTAMNHLFLGLNVKSLSVLPFNPVIKKLVTLNAKELDINQINPNGKVTFLPNIGGFVGSDTIGGMIAADLVKSNDNIVIIDLGTNGEIIVSTSKTKLACSTAAGPAFEGARIKFGMQAFNGAINSVGFDDHDIYYTTINNHKPRGICGSGLIDIISIFIKTGIIDSTGKIIEPKDVPNENLRDRIIKDGRKKEVILAYKNETENNIPISITQKDIREIQLAKSAVKSGINILLKTAGITYRDVDKILLTGAFGNFISKTNAHKIGLFPKIPLEKVFSFGNAAGEGAKMILCDKDLIDSALKQYLYETKHIEISTHPDFQDEFIDGMSFK